MIVYIRCTKTIKIGEPDLENALKYCIIGMKNNE